MGYRLELSKVKYCACGGKLYGYGEFGDEKKLKSHQWLLENGYIDGDESWSYRCNPKILLRPEEFKKFIELYNEDCNNTTNKWIKKPKDYIINKKEIQELINSESEILLEWF